MRADALAAHGPPSAGHAPPSAGYPPLPEETRALGCGRAPGGGAAAAARAAAARRQLEPMCASDAIYCWHRCMSLTALTLTPTQPRP